MAFKNPTNSCGGINGLIGHDIKTVYAAIPGGLPALNTTVTVPQLGGATGANLEDSAYAGKALKFQQAAGAVADGAVVANTYVNRSGKALVATNIVLAVAP